MNARKANIAKIFRIKHAVQFCVCLAEIGQNARSRAVIHNGQRVFYTMDSAMNAAGKNKTNMNTLIGRFINENLPGSIWLSCFSNLSLKYNLKCDYNLYIIRNI